MKTSYFFSFSAGLTFAQAIYFTINGIWPIVHIDSFMAVSGLKTDLWLIKTAGTLITAIGISLFSAGWLKEISIPVILLALLSALGLMLIDIYYVNTDIISPVYLGDALAEGIFICGWCYVVKKKS